MMNFERRSYDLVARVVSTAVAALIIAASLPAAAEPAPPCTDDPSRVIFAGLHHGACQTFNGDQAACEASYYVNRDGRATSCGYVAGTCVGCGGDNGACASNTCDGSVYPTASFACTGDSGRTALLGFGDNESGRCRNLDQTDRATCENAFYDRERDLEPIACWWDVATGWCLGCNDNSKCPFNACNPAVSVPDAPCTGDPGRTNLLGFGNNGAGDSRHPGACRQLDHTDAATCANAWYEDDDDFVPVACWWDGDECRGSGRNGFPHQNVCLGAASPAPDAACPGRNNLLGYGGEAFSEESGIRACRQFDGTDSATCENSFYQNGFGGPAIACWWNAGQCRGSGRHYALLNSCRLPAADAPDAVCSGDLNRTLLGFGRLRGTHACRAFDGTDQTTCEAGFYEAFEDRNSTRAGQAVACFWDNGDCVGCGGGDGACAVNECFVPECTGEDTRSNFLGLGNHRGLCRSLDQTTCENSYYESSLSGKAAACWWDAGIASCRGSGGSNRAENNACRVPAECTREPGRTLLGLGHNNSQSCLAISDETICNGSYYEDAETGNPSACWWSGNRCFGTSRAFELFNACLHEPLTPTASCAAGTRSNLIGFGAHLRSKADGPCHMFDGDQMACEDAFYENFSSGRGTACWYDAGECRGSGNNFQAHDACFVAPFPCLDDGRTSIGLGHNGSGPSDPRGSGGACRQFDNQGACEGAFYFDDDTLAPVACWWDGDQCRGSSQRHYVHNSCLYGALPARSATVTCDGPRTVLLGFGNDHTAVCGQLDSAGQTMCEMAYYEDDDDGNAIACWWDGSESACRGSNSQGGALHNVCAAQPIACGEDMGRTLLGFGDNGSGLSGGACHQFDGMPTECENAYYRVQNGTDFKAVACWFDTNNGDCRGSNSAFSAFNTCRHGPLAARCPGRELLGIGGEGQEACRVNDGNQVDCESSFYVNREGEAIACTWAEGPDYCLGTRHFDTINACDPNAAAPPCPARSTFIGRGGRGNVGLGDDSGACRQFDAMQTECEQAYYVSSNDDAVACWWDSGTCRGSNRAYRLMNACISSEPSCGVRTTALGHGADSSAPCRRLDFTTENECLDAYYVDPSGAPVACNWDSISSLCLGCGRRNDGFGPHSTCPSNACDPVECSGAELTRVERCINISTQSECENSWHVAGTNNHRNPAFAAACVWADGSCFGCGQPNQDSGECINACVSGCGNGQLDDGEQCDDGNMFDGDCCDATCQIETDGSPCTDRLFCTDGTGTCEAGECVGIPERICASCFTGDCNELDNFCDVPFESHEGHERAIQATLQGAAVGMSMPLPEGTMCDDGIDGTDATCNAFGMCSEGAVDPTATPTATPTSTPTSTPTIAGSPTPTLVPEGGDCADTSQCVAGAICVDNVCTVFAAPVPAASRKALLLMLAALAAIGAMAVRRRFKA